MKSLYLLLAAISLSACASIDMPAKWKGLGISTEGLVSIERDSDNNGLYAEYQGVDQTALFNRVSNTLLTDGYKKSGDAFDGTIVGYVKNGDRLAMKVEQIGSNVRLSIFDGNSRNRILHGIIFGKYHDNSAGAGSGSR